MLVAPGTAVCRGDCGEIAGWGAREPGAICAPGGAVDVLDELAQFAHISLDGFAAMTFNFEAIFDGLM